MNAVPGDFGFHSAPATKLAIAVIGAGPRGAGLARAFQVCPDWELAAICDVDVNRASIMGKQLGTVPCFETIDELLDCVEVDAAAIATPLGARHGTAMTALRAGKHVLADEPLADSLSHAQEMAAEARMGSLVLMAGRPHSYEPSIQKIQKLIDAGSLGDIMFVEALLSETNLLNTERDVFWDLAPRSFAVMDEVLPGGLAPLDVSAFGGDPLGTGRDCVGHIYFRLPNDAPVHLHVNRLSRSKCHQLLIAGTRLTVVWDAGVQKERLRVYDPSSPALQKLSTPPVPELNLLQLPGEDGTGPSVEQQTMERMADAFSRNIRRQNDDHAPNSPTSRILAVLEAVSRSRSLDGQVSGVVSPLGDTHGGLADDWPQSVLWPT